MEFHVQFINLSIRGKLTATFTVLFLIVVLVSGLSLKSLSDANQRFAGFLSGIDARTAAAAHLRAEVDQRAISARNLVLVSKPEDLQAEKALVTSSHANVQATLARLNTLIANATDATPKAKELVAEINRVEAAYGPVALGIVDLALRGKKAEAVEAMNEKCRPLLAALIKATTEYAEFSAARAVLLAQRSEEEYATQRASLVGTSVLALLFALLAGVLVTRSITRPISAAVALAQAVSAGDLSSEIKPRGSDELATLFAALARMNASLCGIVQQVRQSSENIATGSAEIASGNADLSRRTEQQASALQQTAATMEELSSTVRNNAENARQANQLALGASGVASKGGEVVGQVVETMRGINDSSRKIAEIISVIDGIAFQTNILALNAAVEAARAGDQGRGFAVVASEVRSLAKRSADAAREIKALIETSVQQVERGSKQVDEAGTTMADIVSAFKRVGDIVAEISEASAEQNGGVSQVSQAVSQMDQVTQQNAALVEESAAAAESLKRQSEQLVEAVAVFKLGHAQHAAA